MWSGSSPWTAGAGRVVAVTPGLGQWTRSWTDWMHWPEVSSGLAGYVAVQSAATVKPGAEAVYVDIDSASGRLEGVTLLSLRQAGCYPAPQDPPLQPDARLAPHVQGADTFGSMQLVA